LLYQRIAIYFTNSEMDRIRRGDEMYQQSLSSEYTDLSLEETGERIASLKRRLGDKIIILGHHYQRDEIIQWADYRGDSFLLSRIAAQHGEAPYIVFCGVHFMAESADILTNDNQAVILPNLSAGCSMADMASIRQVERCWRDLVSVLPEDQIVPITYVNSAATLKAFVGAHGGSCCTSSNASKVMEWALQGGKRLLFFPDQHLGGNTAMQMGYDPETDMALWDPAKPFGGLSRRQVERAQIFLWKGFCSVHERFTVEQIAKARMEFPGIKVIVHPECTMDVVKAADLNGSTEYIIKQVSQSPSGTSWAIGTEVNLVHRLKKEMPDKTIFCLDPIVCPCSTMYRIHPHYLLWVLDNLAKGEIVNRIVVEEPVKSYARISLERMLEIS
jgi:quinolinate synthase